MYMSMDTAGQDLKQIPALDAKLREIEELEQKSLTQWQLIWRDFKKHRLAVVGLVVVCLLYLIAILGEFLTPHDPLARMGLPNVPPSKIHIYEPETGLQRPFVYGYKGQRNPRTLKMEYVVDTDKKFPIYFFVRGYKYKFLGLFETDIHLFGVEEPGYIFLFGTDTLGRDLYSRTIMGTRISTTVGLISIFFSLILGLVLGGMSALLGGTVDMVIQRIIEILLCIPSIPLWMGLSAALPREWSPLAVYFSITIILALQGWVHVARVVRGRFLALKEEQFVLASEGFGASYWYIIFRHLIPNFISYVIVNITVSIPGAILGETSLSFLGLGLRPPVISWGVLLQGAQNLQAIAEIPWLMIPGLFVIALVLSFNFMGDGLRDAADPYRAIGR